MAKAPKNIPDKIGDVVTLRGKGGRGIVLQITERNWVEVRWDQKAIEYFGEMIAQPRICHLYELEKINA
jgi:hypothetical protein